MNFAKFLRTAFLYDTSGGCFLNNMKLAQARECIKLLQVFCDKPFYRAILLPSFLCKIWLKDVIDR